MANRWKSTLKIEQCLVFPFPIAFGEGELVVQAKGQNIGESKETNSPKLTLNSFLHSFRGFCKRHDSDEIRRRGQPLSQSFSIEWIVRVTNQNCSRPFGQIGRFLHVSDSAKPGSESMNQIRWISVTPQAETKLATSSSFPTSERLHPGTVRSRLRVFPIHGRWREWFFRPV